MMELQMKYVIESWKTTHTDEDRKKIWAFLKVMCDNGKHTMADNGTYSTYFPDGRPVKRFDSQVSVNEYIAFLTETFGNDFAVEVVDQEPEGMLEGRHPDSPYVQGHIVD
jgi:hypothetical protein